MEKILTINNEKKEIIVILQENIEELYIIIAL